MNPCARPAFLDRPSLATRTRVGSDSTSGSAGFPICLQSSNRNTPSVSVSSNIRCTARGPRSSDSSWPFAPERSCALRSTCRPALSMKASRLRSSTTRPEHSACSALRSSSSNRAHEDRSSSPQSVSTSRSPCAWRLTTSPRLEDFRSSTTLTTVAATGSRAVDARRAGPSDSCRAPQAPKNEGNLYAMVRSATLAIVAVPSNQRPHRPLRAASA